MATLKYKGKSFETIHYLKTSPEYREKIKREYYEKPPFADVRREFDKIINKNGSKKYNITKYYFRPIMSKVVCDGCKWALEDVFESDDLFGFAMSKIKSNPKTFPPQRNMDYLVETVFRVGGAGVARKPTCYPLKSIREMLDKYCFNGNYYDYSCGWGDRLLGSIAQGVNYFGTDPNYLLTEKLVEMNNDIVKNGFGQNKIVDIRTTGSEVLHEDWQNRMSLCFSSPPYFKLEDYIIGEQSTKLHNDYQDWLKGYLKPTIENCKKYLVDGGYFAINIKNYKSYDLIGDSRRIAEELGFVYVTTEDLDNIRRPMQDGSHPKSTEQILVFQKTGD